MKQEHHIKWHNTTHKEKNLKNNCLQLSVLKLDFFKDVKKVPSTVVNLQDIKEK